MTSRSSLSFLISKRWLGYWALFLAFSVACILLGNWQFDRRAEARAEIERIDANYDAEPLPFAEVMTERTAFNEDQHKWQQIVVSGTYTGESLLVRNRPYLSQVGYEILAPLRLADGSLFIVNRGWLPLSDGNLSEIEIPAPPIGTVEVVARLKAGEPRIADRAAAENSVGTINLPELEELLSVPVYTGAYGLLVSETPATPHGELALRPERDEGPHLSYALQWYVFVAVAAGGLFFGARSEFRSQRLADQQDSGWHKPKIRARKQSDVDDEDAWLDAREPGRG